MSNSLLQLERCFPAALEIVSKVNTCAEPTGSSAPSISFSYNLMKHPDEQRYFLRVNVSCDWEPASDAYYLRIATEWHGFFKLPDDTPDDEIAKYVPALCIANVIGIARGQIALNTGSFLGGAFYLPLLNVYELIANNPPSSDETEALSEQRIEQ